MHSKLLHSAALAALMSPAPALAGNTGVFLGPDATIGLASGSSHTRDGGAPFAGGGVVGKVDLGTTVGLGGHIGYRFGPAWSAAIQYRHLRGDVSWVADFPLIGAASRFNGKAVSDAITANLGYDLPISGRASVSLAVGAGVTFNRLANVVETDVGTGAFLSDVAVRRRTRPIAQVTLGLRRRLSRGTTLGLDASVSHDGGFETGDTRSGNLGITEINPYQIDGIWRANLGASLTFRF